MRFRLRVFCDTVDSKAEDEESKFNCIGRINKANLVSSLTESDSSSRWIWPFKSPKLDIQKTLFLVCGPEPCVASFLSRGYLSTNECRMIAAISGPYGRNLSQGPVGGVLAELGATSNQVYKL